jgi:hypothetical protein
MQKLLEDIKKKFCHGCLVGESYEVIKYDSFGTSIDHNFFENNVPIRFFLIYSTVWEIFGDNSTLRRLT